MSGGLRVPPKGQSNAEVGPSRRKNGSKLFSSFIGNGEHSTRECQAITDT
jgi:hypothetical protein